MQRLMKRGDPFLEGLRTVVMCYRTLLSFHTDRSFRHLESPHLLFPTLIRTSFSLGMQLRQTRSQSHPCSCSHPQTDFFLLLIMGPYLHIILVTVQDTTPKALLPVAPDRFLIPGARLALEHLSVAINEQLSKKMNKS